MLIQFKTKRQDDGTYRLPIIQPKHVRTPTSQMTTRERLALASPNLHQLVTNGMRVRGIGVAMFPGTELELLDINCVAENVPGVTVTPVGNGFMAQIQFEVTI